MLLLSSSFSSYAYELVQRKFAAREGLVSTRVNDIAFDYDGFAWFATTEGLYRVNNSTVRRIDKQSFELRLSNEGIITVEPLDEFHLLVANYTDLYLYNIVEDSFTRFGSETLFPHYNSSDTTLIEPLGDGVFILLTTEGELLKYNHNQNQLIKVNHLPAYKENPWILLQPVAEGFLFATRNRIEYRNRNGELVTILPLSANDGVITSLFKDSQQRVWITTKRGLYRVDLDATQLVAVPSMDYDFSHIVEDSSGSFWLASRDRVVRWHPATKDKQIYGKESMAAANIDHIRAMHIDSRDVLWIGGDGDGVALLTPPADFLLDTFDKRGRYQLENEMIWNIYAEDKHVYLSSDDGIIKLKREQEGSKLFTPDGFKGHEITLDVEMLDDEHLLVSTSYGLYVFNKKAEQFTPFAHWTQGESSLVNKLVYINYRDPQQPERWWFPTHSGLYFWQPDLTDPQEVSIYQNDHNWQPDVRSILRADDGNLWLGGTDIFGYLDEDENFQSLLENITPDGKKITINSIHQFDANQLWLGTTLGVIELSLVDNRARLLNQEWGVQCSNIYFIQDLIDARLIGCFNQLLRFDKTTEKLLVIDKDDGLIGDEFNEGAVLYQEGVGVYIGTPNGAMLLDSTKLNNRLSEMLLTLESVSVLYADHTDLNLRPKGGKKINGDVKMINFQFTNLDYLNDSPLELQYRFRKRNSLEETRYILLSKQSNISITGLDAGKYVLEVLSKNNGFWSEKPFSYSFMIEQVWWKTPWFQGGAALSIILLVMGILIYRHQQVDAFRKINIALIESEDRLRQSLKGSESELWEWHDEDRLFRLENHHLGEQQIKVAMEELTVHEEDKAQVLSAWQAMILGDNDKFDVECRYQRADSSWGWTHISGKPVEIDSTGRIIRVAGIYADITTQRELENEFRLLAEAFENTSEGVLILSSDEKIIVSNRAAQSIIATSAEQLNKRFFSELLTEQGHKIEGEVALLLEQGLSWTGEKLLYSAQGQSHPVWMNISSMLSTTGSVTHYVIVFSDITDRKKSEADLRRLANYDVLTGLVNRSLFATRLTRAIQVAEQTGEKLALLFLDLDRFKYVNDSFGHSMGDALLVEAANRLQSCIDEHHLLCRFGGDEFLILLHDVDDVDMINHLCNDLLEKIKAPFNLFGREFFISTSIGVSLWPDDANKPEALIKNADQAMYHAKEQGKGNVQYFSSERNSEALYHLKLEAELRKAIDNQEFELVFQPQIDILQDDKLIGMEALLRWNHPVEGNVRTDIFIKIAESCGLIVDIDRWVLLHACQQAKTWLESYPETFKMSINISAVHFRQADFIDGIKKILQRTNMPADRLELEITEGVLMKELYIAQEHLRELKRMGVEVAIDDFGTGYSSLAYLRHLDVDKLKIDRSFVIDIATNESDQAITSSIIELARNLKLKVIAEGIETKAQLEQVFSRGCYTIQGYYFSKPLSPSDMEQFMKIKQV